jgi:hypothetical protein
MSHVVVRTPDLAGPDRQVSENLLGRKLDEDEQIAISTSTAHETPTGTARQVAGRRLSEALDAMAAQVIDVPVRELEELVDDVAYKVRHGRSQS